MSGCWYPYRSKNNRSSAHQSITASSVWVVLVQALLHGTASLPNTVAIVSPGARIGVQGRKQITAMADRITPEQRSAIMSRIRSKDTHPEIVVRRMLHVMGFRFRLHVRSLPGCPDIVLPKHSIAVQVRGCFWHLHRCMKRRLPKTNVGYWLPKLEGNRARDIENDRKLRRLGWKVRTIWECQLERMAAPELRARLRRLLI
jgi:DNA mismatch endonuclease, patch repair protein